MVVDDDIIFILGISVDFSGLCEEFKGVVLGLFEEDGNALKVFLILNVVIKLMFDFSLFDEFRDFVILVNFLDFDLFSHFFKD